MCVCTYMCVPACLFVVVVVVVMRRQLSNVPNVHACVCAVSYTHLTLPTRRTV